MKLINSAPIGVIVQLDATDCLAIADALDHANRTELDHKDYSLFAALEAAFTACAVVAALDTLSDGQVDGERALADTRRVWGSSGIED